MLFYFSKQNELIFDPMAGGGVPPETCLAFNRRCWAFDMADRPNVRPEIEPHTWTMSADHPLILWGSYEEYHQFVNLFS